MVEPLGGFKPILPEAKPVDSALQAIIVHGLKISPHTPIVEVKGRFELPLEKRLHGSLPTLLSLVKLSHAQDVEEKLSEAIDLFKNLQQQNSSLEIGRCHVGLNRFEEFGIRNHLALHGPFKSGVAVTFAADGQGLTINQQASELSNDQKLAIWGVLQALNSAPADVKRIDAAMVALQLATDLHEEENEHVELSTICKALATYAATGVRDEHALRPNGNLKKLLEEVKNKELLVTLNDLLEFLKR